jgi:uncharacterized protein YcbX
MVVDKRYVFQTQRTLPQMALIKTSIKEDELTLEAPGMEAIVVKIPSNLNSLKKSCR